MTLAAAALAWTAASFAQAETRPNVTGTWEGKYAYMASSQRREVPFRLELSMRGTSLTGRIIEPNTFEKPSSDELTANVVGIVEGQRLRFVKTYDGKGGQTHSVYYEAMLDAGSPMTMRGNWIINDRWSGGFEAVRR
jgi:hypothetical protein